jgi:hypothetical protein
MGEGRNVYRVLVGKSEGKRPLERPRRRWQDGIKMDLREIGWGALVNAVMNPRVLTPRSWLVQGICFVDFTKFA